MEREIFLTTAGIRILSAVQARVRKFFSSYYSKKETSVCHYKKEVLDSRCSKKLVGIRYLRTFEQHLDYFSLVFAITVEGGPRK